MAALLELGTLKLAGGAAYRSLASPGFFFTDLGDWHAVPDSKSEIRERPQADGAYEIETDWRQSLAYSVKGLYVGASHLDAQMAKRTLKLACAKGRRVTVAVTDVDGRFTRVSSVRSFVPDDDHGRRSFTFTLDLVAFDPLMYGDPVTLSTGVPVAGGGLVWPLGSSSTAYWDWGADGTSGRVTLPNDGTAGTWPTVTATGGLSGGFVATAVQGETVRSVRFERVIPDGSLVSINFRTGRAWIDAPGNDVSGFITVGDFFQVPAGESLTIQFAPLGVVTGSPLFTATCSPAFL